MIKDTNEIKKLNKILISEVQKDLDNSTKIKLRYYNKTNPISYLISRFSNKNLKKLPHKFSLKNSKYSIKYFNAFGETFAIRILIKDFRSFMKDFNIDFNKVDYSELNRIENDIKFHNQKINDLNEYKNSFLKALNVPIEFA